MTPLFQQIVAGFIGGVCVVMIILYALSKLRKLNGKQNSCNDCSIDCQLRNLKKHCEEKNIS